MKQNINIIDFKTKEAIYQVILPLNLALKIPADDSVRLLSKLVDTLDLGGVIKDSFKYSKVPVEIMLKIVVYGYMNCTYSSRGIEKACRRDINFMWLLQGYPPPDHNTIARFRVRLDTEKVLSKITRFLKAGGELDFDSVFIDGTKLEANANRYSFVWKGSTQKNLERLKNKKAAFLKDIHSRYGIKFCSLQGVLDFLDLQEFVSGKGRRKSQKQRDYETALELSEKEKRYESYLKQLKTRNSLSKTDNDATFMRLKDDHMRNGQLKPAYNIQVAVENQYITGTYISSDRDDVNTLKPLLKKLSKTCGYKYKNIVADAGYESEENYVYLKKHNYISYIKPQNYEKSKTRKFKKVIGKMENMSYDSQEDIFICAAGRQLKFKYSGVRETASGYKRNTKIYECESCDNCEVRILCTRAKGNKQIQFSPLFESLRNISRENITTALGIKLRVNRSIQAEGVFGILKQDYGFRRFLMRGHSKISTEFNLLAIAYNIRKLHNNLVNNTLGCKLYDVKQE